MGQFRVSNPEFERKSKELKKTRGGLNQQLQLLDHQTKEHLETAKLAAAIKDFCRRIEPTLHQLNFAQRRQLVELLVDCVIVDEGNVEIRYVVPTNPRGEESIFSRLRLDYHGGI